MKSGMEERVRKLIESNLFSLEHGRDDEADLYEQGLDSLGLMQLIVLLENEFPVSITPEDLDRSNFGCVGRIAGMIAGKLAAKTDG